MKKHKIRVTKDKVVTFHYTLKNDSGEVIDSSQGGEPLSYLHGYGNIVVGLEQMLAGKTNGDSLNVSISPKDGYGERRDDMVITLAREGKGFPDDLKIGDSIGMQTKEGSQLRATVLEMTDSEVKLDCNHPLAGQNLHFDVEITNVRSATKEELTHGHAHGAAGCGH